MDLAANGSEDGSSTPTEIDASMAPPAPTDKDSGTILPAPTGKEAGTTPEKPTNRTQMDTPKPDRPATPDSDSSSSDHNNTEDGEYVSCSLEWRGHNPDCKRMLDNETKMLAHHKGKMENKAVPIFQHTVNKDPELCVHARAQVTAPMYAMREAIVPFDTRLDNMSYFTSGQGKRKTDTEGGRRMRVPMERESLCFSF